MTDLMQLYLKSVESEKLQGQLLEAGFYFKEKSLWDVASQGSAATCVLHAFIFCTEITPFFFFPQLHRSLLICRTCFKESNLPFNGMQTTRLFLSNTNYINHRISLRCMRWISLLRFFMYSPWNTILNFYQAALFLWNSTYFPKFSLVIKHLRT